MAVNGHAAIANAIALYEGRPEKERLDAFFKWIEEGIKSGFCLPAECETHEGVDLVDWEEDEFDEGLDPCVTVIRLLGPYAPSLEPPEYVQTRSEE